MQTARNRTLSQAGSCAVGYGFSLLLSCESNAGYHFHKLVEQGVRKSLQNKLRWIRSEEHPRWRPREQDVKHAKNVLEFMYYHRDLRTSMDDESLAEQQKEDKVRRRRGEELLANRHFRCIVYRSYRSITHRLARLTA